MIQENLKHYKQGIIGLAVGIVVGSAVGYFFTKRAYDQEVAKSILGMIQDRQQAHREDFDRRWEERQRQHEEFSKNFDRRWEDAQKSMNRSFNGS